jgi:hypothetical protein
MSNSIWLLAAWEGDRFGQLGDPTGTKDARRNYHTGCNPRKIKPSDFTQ